MADPVAFPNIGITMLDFDLVDPVNIARMEGRRTEEEYAYEPHWRASFSLPPVNNDNIGALRVFLTSRGTFLAHDYSRPRPLSYDDGTPLSGTRAIGGAFSGDAVINSLSDRLAPVIQGLPEDFAFTAGDYIEFRISAKIRSLHRIAVDAVGNDSGIVTLTLQTPVPQEFTTSHTAHLEKPSCVMKVEKRSTPLTPVNSTFSFEAVEVFPR